MNKVVVTGGSRGVGLGIALGIALGLVAAGYEVIAIARHATKELTLASENQKSTSNRCISSHLI